MAKSTQWSVKGIDEDTRKVAREAARAGLSAPLHSALYRLIKGKEASWTWKEQH